MKQIAVRKADLSDLAALQQVGRDTFFETFAQSNTEADMKKYLEQSFNETKVKEELTNPDSLLFIAWDDDQPIGYLKVNVDKAQTELQDKTALEIERIYVRSTHHGKNVGHLLYEKALEIALRQKKAYIWLGVWEENPRAIRFYEKNGFIAFDKHIFRMGEDEQTDILMKKVLE